MDRTRWIIVAIAAAVLIVVIVQNSGYVNTRILFVTVSMPQAVLLVVVVALGWLVGALTGGKWLRLKR